MATKYPLPERIIDLDAVTEMLYENGNLAEEIYRAVGGGALPFYAMLDSDLGESPLAADLRNAAQAYLLSLRDVFMRHGVYASGDSDSQVEPRELVIERLTPTSAGRRPRGPIYRNREELMR